MSARTASSSWGAPKLAADDSTSQDQPPAAAVAQVAPARIADERRDADWTRRPDIGGDGIEVGDHGLVDPLDEHLDVPSARKTDRDGIVVGDSEAL